MWHRSRRKRKRVQAVCGEASATGVSRVVLPAQSSRRGIGKQMDGVLEGGYEQVRVVSQRLCADQPKSVRHGLLMVPGRNKGRPAGSSLAGVSSLRREVARVDGEKGGGRTGSRNVQGNGPTSGRQSKQQQQSWRVGGRRGAKGRTAVVSGIERHERESERESVRRVVSVCCSVLLWAALGSLLFLDRKREGGARTNQMGSRLAWVGGTCKVEEGCSSQNLQAGCCRSSFAAAGPGSLVRGKVYLLPPYTYMYLWMYLYVWT